jgi:hypothetical protein
MNQFQDTPVTDLDTGRTFLHRSFCASPAEGAAYARLTFANPKLFAIRGVAPGNPDSGQAVIEAAQAYSEGWDGRSSLIEQPEPTSNRIQTELF